MSNKTYIWIGALLMIFILNLPNVLSYCNETQVLSYENQTSQTGDYNISVTRDCTPEYNNTSFLNVTLIFLVLFVLACIAAFFSRTIINKLIFSGVGVFVLLYLTRFSSWFIEITNPEETVLIDTLLRVYANSVYLMKGVLYIIIGLVIILGLKALRDGAFKKPNKGFDNFDEL